MWSLGLLYLRNVQGQWRVSVYQALRPKMLYWLLKGILLRSILCIYLKVALYFLDGQGKILKKNKRLTTKIIQTFVGLLEKSFTRLIGYLCHKREMHETEDCISE